VVHQLSRIDRHDFDPKRPWLIPEAVEAQGAPFQGADFCNCKALGLYKQ
jgi:hypothetical protein